MTRLVATLLVGCGLALPGAVQPRVVDLSTWMTGVKDQGDRGTCSVFAATALVEYLVRRETGRTVNLSESYNYYLGKRIAAADRYLRELYLHNDGLPGFVAVEAYARGSMLESQWPYDLENPKKAGDPRCVDRPGQKISTMCFTGRPPQGAEPAPFRIEPEYVERRSIGDFLLREQRPVVINLLWCGPCIDHRTGRVRLPTVSEAARAQEDGSGHVVALVGYDARRKTFRFRNSRGPHWGRRGYGTIPEAYVVEFCEVCPALSTPPDLRTAAGRFLDRASKGVSGKLTASPSGW